MRAVVLDAESVPAIDVTVAEMLSAVQQQLATARYAADRRDVGQVRDVIDHVLGADLSSSMYPTVRDAVAALDRDG